MQRNEVVESRIEEPVGEVHSIAEVVITLEDQAKKRSELRMGEKGKYEFYLRSGDKLIVL